MSIATNYIPDRAVINHSTMLVDDLRIEKYLKAIQSCIQKDDIVVDIGSGTGILSFLANKHSNAKVISIEYFKYSLDIAIQSTLKNPNIIHINSPYL